MGRPWTACASLPCLRQPALAASPGYRRYRWRAVQGTAGTGVHLGQAGTRVRCSRVLSQLRTAAGAIIWHPFNLSKNISRFFGAESRYSSHPTSLIFASFQIEDRCVGEWEATREIMLGYNNRSISFLDKPVDSDLMVFELKEPLP